jgi:hypothetical protein
MLCYIAVDERFRNRGVGKTLVEEGCKIPRKIGKHCMHVDTSVPNIQQEYSTQKQDSTHSGIRKTIFHTTTASSTK